MRRLPLLPSRTIKQWDLATAQCLHTFSGHDHWVLSIALAAPDTLLSGSQDETICDWNLQTGQRLQRFDVPRPYTDMKISETQGLTHAQRQTLIVLGAIND